MKTLKNRILTLILLATCSTQLVAMKRARNDDTDLPATKKLKSQVDPKAEIAEPSDKLFTIVCHDGTEIENVQYTTLVFLKVFKAEFDKHADITTIPNKIEIDAAEIHSETLQLLIDYLNIAAQARIDGLSEQAIIDDLAFNLEPLKNISSSLLETANYLDVKIFFDAVKKRLIQCIHDTHHQKFIDESTSDDSQDNDNQDDYGASPKKPFKCTADGCGKSFAYPSLLTLHERSHTGEKPFACNVCGKTFSLKGNRDQHENTHANEKSFKCTFAGCHQAFAQNSNLKRHLKVHEGEKPFKCNVTGCGQAFAQNSNLKRHKAQHKK